MLVDRYGNPIKSPPIKMNSFITGRSRQTTDKDTFGPFTQFSGLQYTRPADKVDWKFENIQEETLAAKSASDLIEILIHSSPDLSRARTDMQALINTSFSITTLEEDDVAQGIIDDALLQMEILKEPLTVKLDKIVHSQYIKGATYTECIFGGPRGEERFIDIRVVDPFRVAYQDWQDEERGQYQRFGEVRDGEFIPIESDLVQYLPVNPVDNHPLGVPMVGSAIFPIVFLMGVLKSCRQVIETQAWPQGLVTIDNEKRLKGLSSSQPGLNQAVDPTQFESDLNDLVSDIEERMSNSSKGEIFIYGAEVGYEIVGAMSKANLDAVEMIQKVLDKWIIRATKQFAITFGLNEGSALSTNADQQAELLARQSDALQSHIERVMNIHFTQILRAAGSLATPVFRLKRYNALVEETRVRRKQLEQQTVSGYLADRVITREEYRQIIRHPEGLLYLDELLEEGLPQELVDMEEPNAEVEVSSEGNEGQEETEETGQA